MNTRRDFLATAAVAPLLAAMAPGAQAGASARSGPQAQAFALSRVRLLPGPFDTDRLAATMAGSTRPPAGLPPASR